MSYSGYGGPPPPPPPPPPPGGSGGTVVGLAFVGVLAFVVVNVAVTFIALALAGSVAAVAVCAVALALFAFVGGLLLIRLRKPWAKGLGLGLMIGWALMSIVSVGYCTGLNPALYTSGNVL